VACKEPADPSPKPPQTIILQLEPRKYAVAVWRREESGVPVYEIVNENIRDARVAATVAPGGREDSEPSRGKVKRPGPIPRALRKDVQMFPPESGAYVPPDRNGHSRQTRGRTQHLGVGKTLRRIRKAKGMSQAALAERADLSREYVNKIEAGRYDPPLSTINALAKALGVKPGRFFE
jgi:DNA-binding XRE family transcriptional regulator